MEWYNATQQTIKMKIKNTFPINIGFFFEVLCFFLAGFFLIIDWRIVIVLFLIGLFFAVWVGKLLIKSGEGKD